jgi:hypothetical protein
VTLPPPSVPRALYRHGLGPGQKAAVYLGSGLLAFILLCAAGTGIVGAISGPRPGPPSGDADNAPPVAASSATTQAAATASAGSAASASSSAPQPKVVTTTVTETEVIPFTSRTVEDSTLASGTRKVRTSGVNGVKTRTYQVTLTDGVQTGKQLLREEVTRQPVTEVILVGTKAAAKCDPNYAWACVPIASDVDCAGGTGDGPAYVQGPVKVIGKDIYGLDRDGDGIGCE